MIPLTLEQVADVVGGDLDDPADRDRVVRGVAIDSRRVGPGDLFVALPGDRTDGHVHAPAAVDAGAAGWLRSADSAVVDAPHGPAPQSPASHGLAPRGIAVDDPADALLGLGLWVRDEVDPTVVAITGSNGKTTTKDLVASAVGAGRSVVATIGSQNNELGLPLTCCRLERGTEVLVTELGMRGPGQISQLAVPLRPDVGVVTNVAGVHLELLGSLEAIAAAKAELVEALQPSGTAVLNADDPLVAAMAGHASARGVEVITVGVEADPPPESDLHLRAVDVTTDADARVAFVVVDGAERHPVRLAVPGLHLVHNALAAFAVARRCGVDPSLAVAGIEAAQISPWRMQVGTTPRGVRVLNDAYNANPASTGAALRTLAAVATQGRRVAVLGHMAEIGPTSEQAHADVGALAAELDLDGLVVVGDRAAALADGADDAGFRGALGISRVEDVAGAARLVEELTASGDVVLVKASRSAGLEQVAEALLEGTG